MSSTDSEFFISTRKLKNKMLMVLGITLLMTAGVLVTLAALLPDDSDNEITVSMSERLN